MDLTLDPCPCGGTLRPHRFECEEYDATSLLGVPVILAGRFMGNRCDKGGETTLPGKLHDVLTERVGLLQMPLAP